MKKIDRIKVPASALAGTITLLIVLSLIFKTDESTTHMVGLSTSTPPRIFSLPENGRIPVASYNSDGKLRSESDKNAERLNNHSIEKQIDILKTRYRYDDPRPLILPDTRLGYSGYLNNKPVTPLPKVAERKFTGAVAKEITIPEQAILKLEAHPEKIPYAEFNKLPKIEALPLPEKTARRPFEIQVFENDRAIDIKAIQQINISLADNLSNNSTFVISHINGNFALTLINSCGSSKLDQQAAAAINDYLLKQSIEITNDKTTTNSHKIITIIWRKS